MNKKIDFQDCHNRYVIFRITRKDPDVDAPRYCAFCVVATPRLVYLATNETLGLIWAVPRSMVEFIGLRGDDRETPSLFASALFEAWNALYRMDPDPHPKRGLHRDRDRVYGNIRRVNALSLFDKP